MEHSEGTAGLFRTGLEYYHRTLKAFVIALAVIAAVSVMALMLITCADVVLRIFSRPIKGAYDLVQIAVVITITGALPYTTAVKGHVAIEVFYHKLSRAGRIIMDTFIRLLAMVLFIILGIKSITYGGHLKATGQVTMTLRIPLFWVPYLITFSSFVVVLVILYNLLHPGKEMIKP
ncbi:MAG: TRAP transporter small permease subunit [Spirochaetia bacterium]